MRRTRTTPACSAAGIAASLAIGVGATAASAQAPTFTLRWDAPTPDCPDEASVRGAVERLLGGEDPASAHLEARARVERVSDGAWRERLATVREGVTGGRVIESTSCKSLADATALIVAMAIDPQRVEGLAPPASTSAPAPGPAPMPTTAPAPAPAPAARPAPAPLPASADDSEPAGESAPALVPAEPWPSSRFAAFAALSGGLGALPRAAYGVDLGGALLLRDARLEAYGAFWPAQHVAGASPASGGDISLAAGGVRACWVPLAGRFAFAACPGLEVGDLHGQGTGVRAPESSDGLWLAATALARITWRLAPAWALFLDASMVVPFKRDEFALDQRTVHQAGPVDGVASAGPELRF